MSALGKPLDERSPERNALADAIRRRDAATARITRITEASEKVSVWEATEEVEQAEAALKAARKREPMSLVARVLGDSIPSGPDIEAAELALADAKTSLDIAQRTRDALDGQMRAAEEELGWARSAVRDAIARVVHSENAANPVLAEYAEARREVARLREILGLLSNRGCLPTYWDTVTFFPPSGAEAPWRDALAALESDADAALP
jgi:chromosome segregation ATPase